MAKNPDKKDRTLNEEPDSKTFSIEIANYGGVAHSSIMPGNPTISKAVERFLRDFLKKEDLTVKITEVSCYRKVI